MSNLFSGDFKCFVSELTRLIWAHFIHRGTAISSRGTCPIWPRPRAANGFHHLIYRKQLSSSSFICQEDIQHNVQEEQIAYGRCNKAEVQH